MASQPKKHNRRRRRQLLLVVIIVIVLVIIILFATTRRSSLRGQNSSGNSADYTEFYSLTSEDSVMINYDHDVLDDTGLYLDGEVYLPYDAFHYYLNARFFWDGDEQILRYVLPTGIVSVTPETTEYTVAGEDRTADDPIIHIVDGQMYLSLSFIEQYTNLRSSFYEDPYRVVISDEWGDVSYTMMRRSTEVRELGGSNSPVLSRTSKNDPVTVLEEMDKWTKICTADGFVGYVKNNTLGGTETLSYTSDFTEPEFEHILEDETICLVWHQVTNQTANQTVSSVLESADCVNVISPTWFYLNDNAGGIASLASYDYVDYCHDSGIEVWALISNLENPDVDTTSVLNNTSTRDELINNLISEAVSYDLDGINVDFESLEGEAGTGFLEFIRELSLRCEGNGLVLSVDNYPPAAYNTFYSRSEQAVFADYVILMAYDEHYSGSEDGSVASIGFVRQSVADTLEEVPADQLILGIPFYTRLWQLTTTAEGYDISSEALGMSDAESLVSENGASPVWSEDIGQNYAEYEADGSTYEVWLEDETSIDLKLQVMQENGLAGAAFWKLGYEKSSVWDTIAQYIP